MTCSFVKAFLGNTLSLLKNRQVMVIQLCWDVKAVVVKTNGCTPTIGFQNFVTKVNLELWKKIINQSINK